MFRKFATHAFVAIAMTILGDNATKAADYECYGAFSVYNPTSNYIYYQVSWGNGDWKETCLEPGKSLVHYKPLNDDGTVSKPLIRFDYLAGDGDTTYKTLSPCVYRAHYLDDAKPHHFAYSTCGTKLNLYTGKY